jgi:hypothetical protein
MDHLEYSKLLANFARRHGVECSLLTGSAEPMDTTPSYSSSSSMPTTQSPTSPLRLTASESISEADWLRDLELLHHFCVHTSCTFNPAPEIQTVYRVEWPRIGMRDVPVMHGILAVSSLHLAYLHPQQRAEYALVSAHHQNYAIGFFRRVLPNAAGSNPDGLFILSLVVSICQIASLTTADAATAAAINILDDTAELIALTKGVETVFEPARDALRTGPLRSLTGVRMEPGGAMGEAGPVVPASPYIERANADAARQLALLRDMAAKAVDVDEAERRVLLTALDKMEMCTRLIANQEDPVDPGFIFVFAILAPLEFVGMLYKRHPAALVVLATWGAVVHQFQRYWWIGPRGRRIVEAVAGVVTGGDWVRGLEWPRIFISDDGNIRPAGA